MSLDMFVVLVPHLQDCGFHLLEFIVALLGGPLILSGSHKVNSLLIFLLDYHTTEETSSPVQHRFSAPSCPLLDQEETRSPTRQDSNRRYGT